MLLPAPWNAVKKLCEKGDKKIQLNQAIILCMILPEIGQVWIT